MTDIATIATRYRVTGMDCASCARKIETALGRVPGVRNVDVSVIGGTVSVEHAPEVAIEDMAARVRALGYQAEPVDAAAPVRHGHEHTHDHDHDGHGHDHDHDHDDGVAATHAHLHDHGPSDGPWWRTPRARLTILCGAALALAWVVAWLVPSTERWVFLVAMLIGLVPVARRALAAAMAGTPFSIEMLMTVAALGAVVIGAVEEAATVVFLFLVGELLEGVAAGRARASIRALADLVPATARVERDGQVEEVPAQSLEVGALILVRPGDRIPADGVIVSGQSSLDEAPVTGESTPVAKGPDAHVFAGTINGEGVLRVRVTAAAADNTIAKVIALVEDAQEKKAPTERFIDRFANWYTPAVVVVAALVAIVPPLLGLGPWREWIYKGLAILLIGCPCALVISTPAAIAASLSAGARRGLLLKGGGVLETIGKVTAVAFDKTGTLTEGRPVVTDLVGFGLPDTDVLRLAAALETGSSHPLALGILARAKADRVQVPAAQSVEAIAGKGVAGRADGHELFLGSAAAVAERSPLAAGEAERLGALAAEGKSVSVLMVDGRVAGAIAMRDEPRPDAKSGLQALRDMDIRTIMLTGDNRRTAEAVARDLGIEPRTELLPADKQRIVTELRDGGLIVAKVGDGINDAPALAAADVGIAMGGGTDVALETADAAALHGRVGDIAAMIRLSRRTMRNIKQNITIALGLKAVFLVTTIAGITGLWPAILADTGATVLVTMNALRLLKSR